MSGARSPSTSRSHRPQTSSERPPARCRCGCGVVQSQTRSSSRDRSARLAMPQSSTLELEPSRIVARLATTVNDRPQGEDGS